MVIVPREILEFEEAIAEQKAWMTTWEWAHALRCQVEPGEFIFHWSLHGGRE